jgi:inosine/xanthosine triphosphate pyrophosphatase family protein/diadenosine tetraphosphate (Ap4A) HIT family hydrolase
MLTLVTSNRKKYAPFARDLERLRITLEPLKHPLPEIQGESFTEPLAAKAQAAAAMFGRPVLVDDAGLVLEAYQPFPGPLTSAVLHGLGTAGFKRLLHGVSDRAAMECHIGCWIRGALRSWAGRVHGRLDLARSPRDERMILADLFVADAPNEGGELLHRGRALAALEAGIFELHLDAASDRCPDETPSCGRPVYQCPFCTEVHDGTSSLFADMIGNRLASRVIYEDEHFLVIPPVGEFIEGGLLLLTREHILSFAHLPPEQFEHLERLLGAISRAVLERWGVAPLIFEHGPAPERTKGVCCVDHAHLNIFPARVQVHPSLAGRMNLTMSALSDLSRLRGAEFGYLFVQENDRTRRSYDGENVPSQLVRRIITAAIGMPERWHWRDYPGYDELIATYRALKDQIRL